MGDKAEKPTCPARRERRERKKKKEEEEETSLAYVPEWLGALSSRRWQEDLD